jgi:curved DNA-binding protein CbpA
MLDEDAIRLSVLATNLEEVDYYALLEIERAATNDEIRGAFHSFALRFHPDRHVGDPKVQKLALAIFKRGAEAYRVLMQPTLRSRYDEVLGHGVVRLPVDAMRPEVEPTSMKKELFPSGSRVFYDKARDALRRGDLGGAKMHLALAVARGDSPAFDDLAAQIKAAEAAKKK